MLLSSAFFAYNRKIHYGMGESPFQAFQGHSVTIPKDLVFPELGEPAEDEATQLQDTAGRFKVFYGRMQGMFHGVPPLIDYLWGIYELVWFHAPLRIYERSGHLIKTTRVAIGPYRVVDKVSLRVICIRPANTRGATLRVNNSSLTRYDELAMVLAHLHDGSSLLVACRLQMRSK